MAVRFHCTLSAGRRTSATLLAFLVLAACRGRDSTAVGQEGPPRPQPDNGVRLYAPAEPFAAPSKAMESGVPAGQVGPAAFVDANPAIESAELPSPGDDEDFSFAGRAAASDADRITSLEKQVLELSKKLKDSGKDAKKPDAKKDEKKADDKKKDEPKEISTEKWTVKLGGHMQADFVHWPDATPTIPGPLDYFEFRRLRLLADGTGYGVYDFRIQIDIEPENGDGVATPVTDIKDAYLTMHEIALIQRWRIGNFFVPFGLEQVTNDTNNIFMERSIPTQNVFTADREVGMATYGCNEDKDITWTFGAFIDSISESLKERIDSNQGMRLSGRLTWLPYYDDNSDGRYLLHFGTGVLHTADQDNIFRIRTRPHIHEGPQLMDTGAVPANMYTTGNVEMATVYGPLSVQSELYMCHVERLAGPTVNLYGGYVYLSYFLTGENRIFDKWGQHGAQFNRSVPFTNFFLVPGCYGWGAWEAKCRTTYINYRELGRGEYNDLTVGFNWYWTERVRVMFDWIHPWTTAGAPFGQTSSDILAMRFDFNF